MANLNHIYAGHSDFELSELGREQARISAEHLRDERIDAVYSSSLSRAVQTASPHAELRGLKVEVSDALREMYLGDWDGAERDRLLEAYPYEAVYIWQNFFGLFRAPNGESAPAAAERFYNEVLRIARENSGKTVLIAAHAAVIRLFWGRMLGLSPERMGREVPFPDNASFSFLEYDGERLSPVRYSDSSHLKGLEQGSPKK